MLEEVAVVLELGGRPGPLFEALEDPDVPDGVVAPTEAASEAIARW